MEGVSGGFELMLVQHTDCGLTHLHPTEHAAMLAAYLAVETDELPSRTVGDPHAAVRGDVQLLADNPFVPAALSVSGFVNDVNTREAELVERRSPLR